MRLGVSDPTSAGVIIAAYDASAVNNTDWNSLTATDFYDPSTGTQLDASMKFAFVGAASASTMYLRFRSGNSGDGATNTDGVIPLLGGFTIDSQAISAANSITTIGYKKSVGTDTCIIYAGFNY